MSIMVVDDSEISRAVIRKALSVHNIKDVIEAIDGAAALEKIQSNTLKIDLFILDINMPNMDGLTLLKEIRKTDTKTPVIMLTTETDREKMVTAKEHGATGWIIKPFDTDKLLKVLDMILK